MRPPAPALATTACTRGSRAPGLPWPSHSPPPTPGIPNPAPSPFPASVTTPPVQPPHPRDSSLAYPAPTPTHTPLGHWPSPPGRGVLCSSVSPLLHCQQPTSDLWPRAVEAAGAGWPPSACFRLPPPSLTCSPSPLCPPQRTVGKTCESYPWPSCVHRAAAVLPARNLRLAAARGGLREVRRGGRDQPRVPAGPGQASLESG